MDRLFVYLTNLSSGSAYAIVFGLLLACGLGFPLPEDIPLIATGYLCWDGTMDWLPAVGTTVIGVLAGDSLLFFFGRQLGMKILEQERLQTLFKPEKVRRTRAYFRKYGPKLIFFARFVAGFRAAAFFMAGAMKLHYRRFLLLDALAAAISVPVWIGIGYLLGHYLGDEIAQILKSIRHLKIGFTLISLIVVCLVVVKYVARYRRMKRPSVKRA